MTPRPSTKQPAAKRSHGAMVHRYCVLVPTDFSESSDQALAMAAHLASCKEEDISTEVILLHVVMSSIANPENEMGVFDPERMRGLAQKLSVNRLIDIPIRVETVRGEPGRQIVRLASEWHANVIIMGARRHSTLGHWFGSVSTHVLHNAPCDVITVNLPAKSTGS